VRKVGEPRKTDHKYLICAALHVESRVRDAGATRATRRERSFLFFFSFLLGKVLSQGFRRKAAVSRRHIEHRPLLDRN